MPNWFLVNAGAEDLNVFFFPNPQLVADVEKEEKDNEDQCNPRGKKFYWLTNIS